MEEDRKTDRDNGDDFICDQCRAMDLIAALDQAISPYSGATLVARRAGLDTKCAFCALLADLVLPGTYSNELSSAMPPDAKWQLRSCNMHFASVPAQASLFLPNIQVAMLHAGDGERDYLKHINDEEAEKRGYLAFARTKDLEQHISQGVEVSEQAQSRLIPRKYSPGLVRRWLDYTAEQEALDTTVCKEQQSIPGMSVIDCETLDIVPRTDCMDYIALSYVWRLGNAQKVAVEGYNPTQHDSTLHLPSIIPVVVENAMVVARDLGYRYLWVDQFCIDQNSADKAEQISRMDLIYASASVTIIAASSQGALPGVGNTPRTPQSIVKLGEITVFSTTPFVNQAIKSSLWDTRGWCFQESALSPWRLYFTDYQLLFQSRYVALSDSFPVPPADEDDTHGLQDIMVTNNEDMYESNAWLSVNSWDQRLEDINYSADLNDPRDRFRTELTLYLRLLRMYTTRNLTEPSDAINAWRGIMNIFRSSDERFKIVAGLPVLDVTPPPADVEGTQSITSLNKIEESDDEGSDGAENILSDSGSVASGPPSSSHIDTDDTESSVRCEVTPEELQSTQMALLRTVLRWEYMSEQRPERRRGFPSWSWAGWEGEISWDKPLRETMDTDDMMIEFFAIETATAGNFIDWAEVPAASRSMLNTVAYSTIPAADITIEAEIKVDPPYLIGKAYIVPQHLFTMQHTWSCLTEHSRLFKAFKLLDSALSHCLDGISDLEAALRGKHTDSWTWKYLRPSHAACSRVMCKTARVLSRISRLHSYLSRHRVSRVNINAPSSSTFRPQRLRTTNANSSPAALAAAASASEQLGRSVAERLESAEWSCLLISETSLSSGGGGRAKLLIVQWEVDDGNESEEAAVMYCGRRLRTCSRVGTMSLDMHYALSAGLIEEGGSISRIETLEQVYFRLG
ncbi:HET domain-containing protein [Microdochium nivale]|nr:HET domain-containing protein [Microdochium nivale]